jgi:Flp pilus assembly pilin Flp
MDANPLTATPDRRRHRGERGQGYVEYGLILVIIAIGVLLLLEVVGHTTGSLYSNIGNAVGHAQG